MLNVITFNKKISQGKVSSKRKAFSLIELSIVLIIIGLLVAGVTGGASLIKSAELRSVMGEARGYSVAVNSFFVQYDALPGDFDVTIGSAGSVSDELGDNNDRIEFVNSALGSGAMEGVSAWEYLSEAGMIDTTVTEPSNGYSLANGVATGVLTPGTHLPSSRIKNGGWVFDYIHADSLSGDIIEQNVVILTAALLTQNNVVEAAGSEVPLAAVPVGVITPGDALSIDSKMDDGIANAGEIRAAQNLGVASPTTTTPGCFDNDTADVYATNLSTKHCSLTFHIDVLN